MDRVRESVREGVRDTRHLVMADSNSGSHRMLTLLVLLVGLVCLANLIVVSVMLNKPVQPDVYLSPTINTLANPLADSISKMMDQVVHNLTAPGTSAVPKANTRRRRAIEMGQGGNDDVFLVQYGKAAQAMEADLQKGDITTLIQEVCQAAGVVCLPVYDDDANCLVEKPGEQPVGGKGLLGSWYDACLGWERTAERERVFAFSRAIHEPSSLHVLMARKDSEMPQLWNHGLEMMKGGGKVPCRKGDVACLNAMKEL